MKPVLLVVDVQKRFFDINPIIKRSLEDAIENINVALALFRETSLPVISVQHVDDSNGLVPGSQGFELPDGLNILPSDVHIHKRYGNSFNKTSLAHDLAELGVDTVVVTGFCAEYCVLSAYRGAEDADLNPVILTGAIASGSLENIKFVESITDTISLGALEKVVT